MLARKVLSQMSPVPALFGFSYFLDKISCLFCLELASDHDPPKHSCCVAGITDVCYYTQLVCWDEEGCSLTFSQGGLESDPPNRHLLSIWNYRHKADCLAFDSFKWVKKDLGCNLIIQLGGRQHAIVDRGSLDVCLQSE